MASVESRIRPPTTSEDYAPGAVYFRTPRRHSLTISGGVPGVSQVITELLSFGRRICSLSVEVHDGVGVSGLSCTVLTTAAEADQLGKALRQIPGVTV